MRRKVFEVILGIADFTILNDSKFGCLEISFCGHLFIFLFLNRGRFALIYNYVVKVKTCCA